MNQMMIFFVGSLCVCFSRKSPLKPFTAHTHPIAHCHFADGEKKKNKTEKERSSLDIVHRKRLGLQRRTYRGNREGKQGDRNSTKNGQQRIIKYLPFEFRPPFFFHFHLFGWIISKNRKQLFYT